MTPSLMKGEKGKARLIVLRGKWKGGSADYLADLSELPYLEVENMLKDYDTILQAFSTNKPIPSVSNLTDEEVNYLRVLFAKS